MNNKYYKLILNKSGNIPDFPVYAEEIENNLIDLISYKQIKYAQEENKNNINGISYNTKYPVEIKEVVNNLKKLTNKDILNYRITMYYLNKEAQTNYIETNNTIKEKNQQETVKEYTQEDLKSINSQKVRIRKQLFKIIEID